MLTQLLEMSNFVSFSKKVKLTAAIAEHTQNKTHLPTLQLNKYIRVCVYIYIYIYICNAGDISYDGQLSVSTHSTQTHKSNPHVLTL